MYFYKPATQGGGASTGTNFLSNFFPFGKTNTNTGTSTNTPANISGYVAPTNGATTQEKLTKVSSMPIAGYGVFMKERYKDVLLPPLSAQGEQTTTTNTPSSLEKNTTTKTAVKNLTPTQPLTELVPGLRYVERATGNIYQTFADKIEEQKFTNSSAPKVYEAYFANKGGGVVMRYLNKDNQTIETYAGTLPKETLGGDSSSNTNEFTGQFLPENITDMSISPNSLSLFYVFDNGDTATGVTAQASGNKKNQIFNSPFTEWLTSWPNDRMITLNTKPSYGVQGFMYSLDPVTKKMNKILSGIYGLTTLTSPNGKLILYGNNNLSLNLYNLDTQDSIALGIKTLPEKCVWNSGSTAIYCAVPKSIDSANYPDSWYQGETSFSDQIWKVNVDSGSASIIADPVQFSKGEDVDGIKLSLDESEKYLFFVNKKDSYLWELSL